VPERSIPEPPEPLPARQAAHDAGAEPPAASEATDEPPGADEGATARYEGLPATAPVPSVLLPADEVVDEREPSAEPA